VSFNATETGHGMSAGLEAMVLEGGA
jgi:hypothetical protein